MFSGVKVYNGELNYTPGRRALTTYFEKAARAGKSIGVVTNVSYTDAAGAVIAANKLQVPYVFVYNKDRKDAAGNPGTTR